MFDGNPHFVLEEENDLEDLVEDTPKKLSIQKTYIAAASFEVSKEDEILF